MIDKHRFWEAQTTVESQRIFKEPEILWIAAKEYFIWEMEHPLTQMQFVGRNGEEREVDHVRPFTWQGIALFLRTSPSFIFAFETEQKAKDTAKAKEFLAILAYIRSSIYKQKFDGAAVGAYNSNLISRDLGLMERQEITQNIHTTTIEVSAEEAAKIMKQQDKEF